MLEKSPFRFFFRLIWAEFPKRTLLISALSILSMGLVTLEPVLLKNLLEELDAETSSPAAAYWLFGLIAGVWVAALICNRVRDYVEMRTSPDLRLAAQMRIYRWLDQHSGDFFRSHHSSNLAQKVKQPGTSVLSLTDIIFDQQVRLITAVGMALWALDSVPSYFALVLLIWLFAFLPLSWWFAKRVLPLSQGFGEAASRSSGVLGDIASNMDAVRAFNQIEQERRNFRQSLEAEKQASLRVRWFLILMNTALYGAQILFQSAFVGLAVYAHIQGQIGTPELVMISSLSAILLASVWGLTQNLQGFYDQAGVLRAALLTISEPHAIESIPNAPALECTKGAIDFKDIDFHYGNHRVFEGFNLSIRAHEKVGLVGPSGAGKSTLFKLLQRQFDPQSGCVLIDSQDLRTVSTGSIAQAITEVPQEPALFHRSLRDNILYGNPTASDEELAQAISLARCQEFIDRRPEGLEAIVGERGLRLSGGERQRIALARAFVRNSPIVLLDEATSAIDSENEAEIQAAIAAIRRNRTVLAIAHRLSTVQAMDRILVIDQGRLIDSADHATLLGRCALYAKLWSHQSKS